MCFLVKLQGILISPALYFPNLTLFCKGTFFNWNLNVRDLKPHVLKQLLSQDYECIAHEQLTFFLGIVNVNSGFLSLENS